MASFLISFEVAAVTRWGAIEGAVNKLRTGVKLNGVHTCDEVAPGLWKVTLHVWEDI